MFNKKNLLIKSFIICILFSFFCDITLLSQTKENNAQTIEKQIHKVETGLLPQNVFEGEPGYSIKKRMKFYDVPGISITVIKDYKVLWTKYYGVADRELNIPVTDKTLFNVGSLSKGVAALTVLSLVEQGKVNLEEDINKKLVSWKVPMNKYTARAIITPKLLMNHSGGIIRQYGQIYTRENFPTITQYLKGELPAKTKPTIADRVPGTEFLYSNSGYAILQQMVEDVTGKPFYIIGKQNVFDVLEMNNTSFQQPISSEAKKNAAAAHVSNRVLSKKRYFSPNAAASGLWTTTYDYAKYVIELQKSFQGRSNKIISRSLTEQMLNSHISTPYGLGVFIMKMGNEIYFSHAGDNYGFFARFVSHRTDGNAVIIFTNTSSSSGILNEITRAVAKTYKWNSYLPKIYKLDNISKKEKLKLTGRYKYGTDQLIEVVLQDENLFFIDGEKEQLFHIGKNTFKVKRKTGEIKFYKDDNNNLSRAEFTFANNMSRQKKIALKMKKNEKIPRNLLDEGKYIKAAVAYRKIHKKKPQDYSVSENRLNRLGYQYLRQNKPTHALCVFKINIEFYPNSANAYDSYAEALMKDGDIENAIKNYKKSIELNPNLQNAIEMLKKLKK